MLKRRYPFQPYNTSNHEKNIQQIDFGLARYVSVLIGNYLDGWLMVGENMYQCEDKMNAGERIILRSKLVSNNLIYLTTKETYSSRMSDFECTVCIITMLENYYCDKNRVSNDSS